MVSGMKSEQAVAEIVEHAEELKALGVMSVSLFGSTSRGEEKPGSDIDVVISLAPDVRGLAAIRCLSEVKARLTAILKTDVDVVREPTAAGAMKSAIDRDRRVVF